MHIPSATTFMIISRGRLQLCLDTHVNGEATRETSSLFRIGTVAAGRAYERERSEATLSEEIGGGLILTVE